MKLRKLLKNSQSIKIFNGKTNAEKILLELKQKIVKEKTKPKLAVILVGKDRASELYIKLKSKAARKIGLKIFVYKFKSSTKEENIIHKIEELNNNNLINGIIIQMPLPQKINFEKVLFKINPKKDVDGFHQKTFFDSPLTLAILIALKDSKINLKNKKIISLVNSKKFGEKLKKFFNKEKVSIEYILRKQALKKDLIKKINKADILITVCGVPNLIKNDMIKKGSVLIDAGITWPFGKKPCGDICQKSAKEKALFFTPTPGGLGPLTVALLLKNVYLSFKKYGKHNSTRRAK